MKALLIDSGVVQQVEIADDLGARLSDMYQKIKCQTITGAGYPDDRHAAYADDEGLMVNGVQQVHKVTWHHEPLAGRILITGFDHETGEDRDVEMSVEDLREMVLQYRLVEL